MVQCIEKGRVVQVQYTLYSIKTRNKLNYEYFCVLKLIIFFFAYLEGLRTRSNFSFHWEERLGLHDDLQINFCVMLGDEARGYLYACIREAHIDKDACVASASQCIERLILGQFIALS